MDKLYAHMMQYYGNKNNMIRWYRERVAPDDDHEPPQHAEGYGDVQQDESCGVYVSQVHHDTGNILDI